MIVHCFVSHRAGASISQAAPEPLHESPVLAQFLSEFAADHQLTAWTRQPIEESLASRRAVAAEYFVCYVGINDSAHYNPIRPSRFVHEELTVAVRCIQYVPLFIESQGMDTNVEIRSIEEQ